MELKTEISQKLHKTNGYQRIFIIASGFYFIVLTVWYISIYLEIKRDHEQQQLSVVMTVLDTITPLPKIKASNTANLERYLNEMNYVPTGYYIPGRTSLSQNETEELARLGYNKYFTNLVRSTNRYDFKQVISKMEDIQSSWRNFLLLSLPCFLFAWIVPCAVIYFVGLLSVWVFKGFKKNDSWIERL